MSAVPLGNKSSRHQSLGSQINFLVFKKGVSALPCLADALASPQRDSIVPAKKVESVATSDKREGVFIDASAPIRGMFDRQAIGIGEVELELSRYRVRSGHS
ncbi:MAG: hypothetical protein JOY54_03915 [Acidobacteriaceae bacterium]|nr:hypothetical protein [Acidobacteriaceae bacterium]